MFYPVQLDKLRNLRYTYKSIVKIEKMLGVESLFEDVDLEKMGVEKSAIFIWGGLIHEDDELTVDDVMEFIDEYIMFHEIMELSGKAFADYFTKQRGQVTEKNLPKAAKKRSTQ